MPNHPRKHCPCPTCGGKDRFRFDDIGGHGSWFCNQCTPQAGDGFRLVQNVRGCDFPEAVQLVAGVLGFNSTARAHRPAPRPAKIDRVALAFGFELAALDRRLRAERIVETGKNIDVASLSDDELDRAIAHVVQAHTDSARAALFEGVADDLRMKAYLERQNDEQPRHIA